MFYSKSKNMWFAPDFRDAYEASGTWPDDAKEYPDEVFDAVVRNRGNMVMQPDINGDPVLVEPPPPNADQLAALEAKQLKVEALSSITVTTASGKVFDGNETARTNMLSAITAASFLGQTSASWKLADNTVVLVTLDEVKEALALSIQRVGEIVTA